MDEFIFPAACHVEGQPDSRRQLAKECPRSGYVFEQHVPLWPGQREVVFETP